MPRRNRRLRAENLEERRLLAANLYVTSEISGQQWMGEYDPQGSLVEQISIESPGATIERARDLIVAEDGNIHFYNGTDNPYLSSLDPTSETWTHQTTAGWSTFSHASYGGIGIHEQFVFVTDMWGGGAASPKGIVRFDLDTGAATRFDNWYSYTDLTVGQDGLLYAQSHRTIRVYDPDSLALQRTVQLPFSIDGQSQVYRGIAVNDSGEIFAASWREQVHRFDANGVVQQSVTVPKPDPFFGDFTDIDLSNDGELALGTYWGWVVQMQDDFTDISMFDSGASSVFVAFPASTTSPTPSISISDTTLVEGDAGTSTAEFEISLSNPSDVTIQVDYATVDQDATAGSDYLATSGQAIFLPGETTKLVSVTVTGDTEIEANESFDVVLSNPVFATVSDGTGTGTIVNDDVPQLSVAVASATEGPGSQLAFVVTLSAASFTPITVDYSNLLSSGTAVAGEDFVASSGTLVFAPVETQKTILIDIIDDSLAESVEIMHLTIHSAVGATIIGGSQTQWGFIHDDDA